MSKITSAIAALGVVAGLGVAALPLSSYAVESGQVTVRATVNSNIAVSTNGDDLVDFGELTNGSGEQVQSIKVTVSGSVANYALGVMDYDDNTDMVNVSNSASTTKIETITTPAAALTGGWGFRSEDRHASGNQWQGMPAYNAAGVTNLVTSAALNTNADTTVQFGINIDGLTLDNGTYEDKVIFTAVDAGATTPSE